MAQNEVNLTSASTGKPPKKAQVVADYLEGPFKNSGMGVGEIARMVGYQNQNNLSMAKSGSVVLPMNKIEALTNVLPGVNRFELATLVFKTWDRERYDILKRCGVVIDEEDRKLLDAIKNKIPAGDIDEEFVEALSDFVSNY